MAFGENITNFDYPSNSRWCSCKNLAAALLFVDFPKSFDSIHVEKMGKILLTYDLPKESVAAIMILYRSTKIKFRTLDEETDYINIIAGEQQGDTSASYLFIICLKYVLRTSIDLMKENGFKQFFPSSGRVSTAI